MPSIDARLQRIHHEPGFDISHLDSHLELGQSEIDCFQSQAPPERRFEGAERPE